MFWLIRSVGEIQYWFHQQFTKSPGNPPEKFWFYKVFKNDSVWIVYQIYWQSIAVASAIATVYLAHLWLDGLK